MKKLIYTAIAGIGLLGSMSSAMADDITDYSSLARNVTGDTAIEAINPFFILRDTNSDSVPDICYVEFRVFAGGTNTPLVLKSIGKSTALPAVPCTNPQWSNVDINTAKFLGQTGSSRSHVAVELVARCQEAAPSYEHKESLKTFIYSADLSTNLNTNVWTYTTNRELEGFDILKDTAGAETDNAMITTMYPIDPSNERAGCILTKIIKGEHHEKAHLYGYRRDWPVGEYVISHGR